MECNGCDYSKAHNCKQQCLGSLKTGGDEREAVLRGYHDELMRLCKQCGSLEQLRTLVAAAAERRAIILHKFACKGDQKPKCFYTDTNSPWCLGLCNGDEDEVIDNCKKCWYCENGDFAEARAGAES